MGLMKKLAAIIGLTLVGLSIANVEFGALMGLEPPQKVILSRLADPGCNADEIQKDLDSGDLNACVTTPGVWEALIYCYWLKAASCSLHRSCDGQEREDGPYVYVKLPLLLV